MILNWAENAISLVFQLTSFHQPVFFFLPILQCAFFFILSDFFFNFLSRALIPLCLNSRINERACAKSASFQVELGIINAAPVSSTKGYRGMLIHLSKRSETRRY